jgi:hypothetical protein
MVVRDGFASREREPRTGYVEAKSGTRADRLSTNRSTLATSPTAPNVAIAVIAAAFRGTAAMTRASYREMRWKGSDSK